MRIVFMGTPDFAVTILEEIISSKHEVVGVVTAPDRKAGRGQKINMSAVKKCALQHELPLAQPEKLKAEDFHQTLKEWNADLFVVVAFRMLPKVVWDMPPKGTINLHASLLPDYRGAAPINWAIINGEEKTGVTTFFIEEKIDTGDLLLQAEMKIGENTTAGELHDDLAKLGKNVVVDTLNQIESNSINAIPQKESAKRKEAPKLFKPDCEIDWTNTAKNIHDFVRGLNPYPGSHTYIYNKEGKKLQCKLSDSRLTDLSSNQLEKIKTEGETLLFAASDKYVSFGSIQLEGKRRMTVKEFLVGNNLEDYTL